MVEIEVLYEDELHASCQHGPSGAQLVTDAPLDNHGRGASFSPTDLVATALGSCMLTVMGILADRHGWALRGARARVEKQMTTDPVRRIGRLVVESAMPADLPREARSPLEHAAKTFPGRHGLHADVEAGQAVGISGTPAFVVNGRLLPGARPIEDFVALIDAELARSDGGSS